VGDLSAHFSRWEFAEHGSGALPAGYPVKALVDHLELVRSLINRPLPIVSGYRSIEYNRRIGGARHSRHIVGAAADVPSGYVTVDQAVAAGFTGIGRCGLWAVHLDVRRLGASGGPVIFEDCP